MNYRGLHQRKSGAIKLSENLMKTIQSWCPENVCHVLKTEIIGNHSKFVSKINLLLELNVENSKKIAQQIMVLMNSSNTYSISGFKILEIFQ